MVLVCKGKHFSPAASSDGICSNYSGKRKEHEKMKSKKRSLLWAVILFLVFAVASPASMTQVQAKKAVKAKSVTLNRKNVTLEKGKKLKLKATVKPKKATQKKIVWSSGNKKVATVSSKGVVKAKKKGKTVITAKIGKKKLKCKITVKQKVVKKKTVYQSQMVENFESYTAGTDWGNYTLGEGLTSGGNEPAHYLAKGETMKVITDPENANNKVLQVIPKFYSFCPVFTVDLEKLTGISAKKLGDYKGIRVKVRVVSDASRHVGIGINSFFGKAGTINKKYAFNTYTTQSNALPNEKEYYKFYYTEGMVTPETPDDGSMPQVENGKSAKGHKFKETDKDVGFATKTLLFNKKLTADLRSQTTFDFVVGGSYGPANKEYLAWYLDDVELIY